MATVRLHAQGAKHPWRAVGVLFFLAQICSGLFSALQDYTPLIPEKSVTEISREARVLYQKGNDDMLRENFEYAIALFNQVLEKEPGLFECRKALRLAQITKAGGRGGFFKKMLSSASSSPLIAKAQMALRKNPAEALHVAEQILNSDPNNSAGHRLVVEAATALEMPYCHHVAGNPHAPFTEGQGAGHPVRQRAGGNRRSGARGKVADGTGPHRPGRQRNFRRIEKPVGARATFSKTKRNRCRSSRKSARKGPRTWRRG